MIIAALRGFRDELPDHIATDTDEAHVRGYLDECHRDGCLVYALETDETGKPVALALGLVFPDWTRPVKICADLAFFVAPEHRGKGAMAKRLYQAFEGEARRAGAVQLHMTNQHPDFEDAADRFYRHHGFVAVGRSYQKEL
ncbi:MAG: GNAT family N-acetyltransferase [Geminicoccaceae bacterium]